MNAVEVIVDPTDDVAVVHAIQKLARSNPAVVAVSVPPRAGTVWEPVLEMLRALGKDQQVGSRGALPTWSQVEMWLEANGISEIIALHAQYLAAAPRKTLLKTAQALGLHLVFVYTGEGCETASTTSIDAILNRTRRQPNFGDIEEPSWPDVPDVELLKFRLGCAQTLAQPDRARVDALIRSTAYRITSSNYLHRKPSREELRVALAVASCARGNNLHRVLLNAALLGLIASGRAVPEPKSARVPFAPQYLATTQIHSFLSDIDPVHAALEFLRAWTGLPDDLLTLIAPEQVTASSVAGIDIPTSVRPIFRALTRNGGRWCPGRQRRHALDHSVPPGRLEVGTPQITKRWTYCDEPELLADILSRALRGVRWPISRERVVPEIQDDIDRLVGDGLLESRGADTYEITARTIQQSALLAPSELRVGARPFQILHYLVKTRGVFDDLDRRVGLAGPEKRHFRIVRELALLVALGHVDPTDTRGSVRDALAELERTGYIATFGPSAYRLTELGAYSLGWARRPFGDYGPAMNEDIPSHPREWVRGPSVL
jgi:hypothetical protein